MEFTATPFSKLGQNFNHNDKIMEFVNTNKRQLQNHKRELSKFYLFESDNDFEPVHDVIAWNYINSIIYWRFRKGLNFIGYKERLAFRKDCEDIYLEYLGYLAMNNKFQTWEDFVKYISNKFFMEEEVGEKMIRIPEIIKLYLIQIMKLLEQGVEPHKAMNDAMHTIVEVVFLFCIRKSSKLLLQET